MITVLDTAFEGLKIIVPGIFSDARGCFFESYNRREFNEKVGDVCFVQDNQSVSVPGVIRGMHFQKGGYAQSKLVRAVSGSVLDVCVDMRKGSRTFGRWGSFVLSAENARQLFIPKGFAHGFAVIGNGNAVFQYKCDTHYVPGSEGSFNALDPALGIDWGVAEPILSDKDSKAPLFKDLSEDCFYIPE